MNRPPDDTPHLWIEYHCGRCSGPVEPDADGFGCETCHVRWSVDATDGSTSWPDDGYVPEEAKK